MLGETFCKKFPPAPPSKTPNYANKFSFAQCRSEGKRDGRFASVSDLAPKRQGLQLIGVFGEGSGEALFAKRASPETLDKSPKCCSRL